jgi:hypothetical protein
MQLSHALQLGRWPVADPIWKGKKLLVDFDGTLVDSKKREDGCGYELERVRHGAMEALSTVNARSGRCFITSAGCDGYIREMAGHAGLTEVFEKIFDCDDLRVMIMQKEGKLFPTSKSYDRVMYHIGEDDPAGNCAIIGNDPGLDVPRSPQGVVTVLSDISLSMAGILRYLESLLLMGQGSFARGFDRLCAVHPMVVDDTKVSMFRENSWYFTGLGTGKARVALFGIEKEQIMSHLP